MWLAGTLLLTLLFTVCNCILLAEPIWGRYFARQLLIPAVPQPVTIPGLKIPGNIFFKCGYIDIYLSLSMPKFLKNNKLDPITRGHVTPLPVDSKWPN